MSIKTPFKLIIPIFVPFIIAIFIAIYNIISLIIIDGIIFRLTSFY